MRVRVWMVALCLQFAMSTAGYAQDATISGTVVDESKGALPGVTIMATAVGTGRQFTDVTSERGEYRLVGLSAGRYNLLADLGGFAPVVLNNLELLVGQNAAIAITMKLASLQENITVSGETPLVDMQQARVAGNVDRRQMEEIPISGRDWKQLSMLVKGITANSVDNRPGVNRDAAFQLNLDGQNITQSASNSGFGEAGVSRDAIAEYQIITNLFDVTMGRSTGIQVQAVSKAGTNTLTGSGYGYFRSDRLNAKDAFTGKVLPYSDQQVGGTLGGPIRRDKMQFFASYEGESEPNTIILTPTTLPGEQFSIPTDRTVRNGLGRVDFQATEDDHVTVRSGYWRNYTSHVASSNPSTDTNKLYDSNYSSANWSRVVSHNMLQEVKLNYFHYHWLVQAADGIKTSPTYSFPGLSLGTPSNQPQNWFEDFVTGRYDLTWQLGPHGLKIGSEVRVGNNSGWWKKGARGTMSFSSLPSDAVTRFPADAILDPGRWDLTGLDSRATTFNINYFKDYSFETPRPMVAGWLGDNWKIGSRTTLNLGVKYDVAWRDLAPPGVTETTLLIDSGIGGVQDFGYSNSIRDFSNLAPRVGVAWSPMAGNDFVIRGGSGLYFSTANSNQPVDQQLWNGQNVITNTYTNDGKPGWVLDPTRGVTAAEVLSGKVPLQPQAITVIARDFRMPVAVQSMVGFQKQVTSVIGFDADLVYYRGSYEDSQRDPNLFYDPATGLPKNPNIFGRPNPAFGPIHLDESHGKSDYLALATSFTRRYQSRFQLGTTYTLMFYKHDTGTGSAGYGATQFNPFDIMADWATSSDFQRHTVRVNGVWNVAWGITLSGTLRYGSGNPSSTTSTNVDLLGTGSTRVRRDLTVIPRNNFYGDPFKTVDLRASKDFPLGRGIKMTGIVEVFNAFNQARYGYNTIETSPTFGQRSSSSGSPRTGQLALRLSF